MAGMLHWMDDIHYRRAMRRERVIRDRRNPLDIYDDVELHERFRLHRPRLLQLIDELRPEIQHQTGRNGALSPELQTLIALRFFASGCFQNLSSDCVQVDRTTACRAIRRVACALQTRVGHYVSFPLNRQRVETVKQQFFDMGGFPNVLACVDGTHIPIMQPSEREWEYVNRKGVHSINIQIMCDSELNIVNYVVKWPGSTHDSRILTQSEIYRHFENNDRNCIILGDSGYPLKSWLMVPFLNPTTEPERQFNRAQRSTRNTVERCIGILKKRFACLNKLRMTPERACTVIVATCILHNICMLADGQLPIEELADDEEGVVNNLQDINGRMARRQIVQNYFT